MTWYEQNLCMAFNVMLCNPNITHVVLACACLCVLCMILHVFPPSVPCLYSCGAWCHIYTVSYV